MSIIGTIFNTVAAGTLYLASQYPAATENLINSSIAKIIALYKKTDLTPRAIEAINKAPKLDLKEIVFAPPENKTLISKIIRRIFDDLMGESAIGKVISEYVSKKVVKAPLKPALPPKWVDKKLNELQEMGTELERKKEILKKEIEERNNEATESLVKEISLNNFTNFVKTKLTSSSASKTLKTEEKEFTQRRLKFEQAINAAEASRAEALEDSKAVDTIIYKVFKTLVNTMSIERNVSSILNIIFVKLTEVLTALQNVDWVHSSNIKQDFAERLTRNMNIGPNGFETFKKKKIKKIGKNADKILSKIEVSGLAATATLKVIKGAINNGPFETALNGVVQTLSDLLFDHSSGILSPKQIHEWIENGIDLGPLKLFGQKKLFITPDEATSLSLSDDEKIKHNLYTMIEMVVFTLIDVLIDAIANYTDWSSDQRQPADQNNLQENFEDFILVDTENRRSHNDQKDMPVDLQKNFEGFIDAAQTTLGAVLDSKMQRESEKNVSVNKPKSNADVGTLDSFENLVFRALLGSVPVAAKLPCWFIKKIRIEEVVSKLSTYLEEVAQT